MCVFVPDRVGGWNAVNESALLERESYHFLSERLGQELFCLFQDSRNQTAVSLHAMFFFFSFWVACLYLLPALPRDGISFPLELEGVYKTVRVSVLEKNDSELR